MASHRFLFYVPDAAGEADVLELSGDEHHHLSRVLRARAGSEVYATDGRGLMLRCTVRAVGEDATALDVTDRWREDRGPGVTLALALIEKGRFAQAFEQCAELGVDRLIPFAARRSRVRRAGAGTVERLRRIAISAMKQSFRAWLPRVEEPADFDAVLREVAAADHAVFGEQGAAEPPAPGPGATLAVVGPEAGLSGEEVEALLRAGARGVRLSRYRLRAETAAVAMVAALVQGD